MNLLPVTVLTGFLGAGKTSLLNALMEKTKDEQVIVIINEFGDVGIDHEFVLANENEQIYQMNNGCMCCILRDDLVEQFHAILQARQQGKFKADRIIIETSGLAEPSPIIQTILRTPVLSEEMSIDSVITLVDSQNAASQSHFTEFKEQIAYTDLVLLTKTDKGDKEAAEKIVRAINPWVSIKELDLEQVRYEDYIGLDLFDHGQDTKAMEESIEAIHVHHHDHDEHHHHHHSDIETFSLTYTKSFDEELLLDTLGELIMQYGPNMMRYKGIVDLAGADHKIILQGVNMVFRLDEGSLWSQDKRQSKLVFIGQDMPQQIIEESLEKCWV